jgi:hypothetical protein
LKNIKNFDIIYIESESDDKMAKISFNANMARQEVKEVLRLRAEAEEKAWQEALEIYLTKHCDAISEGIAKTAQKGFDYYEYELGEDKVNDFCINPRTQIATIVHLLIEAGYDAYPSEEESGMAYTIHVEW